MPNADKTSLVDRLEDGAKKLNLKAYLLKEEIKQLGRRIRKEEKDGEEAKVRELKKKAAELQAERDRAAQMSQGCSLGVRLLKGYLAYRIIGAVFDLLTPSRREYGVGPRSLGQHLDRLGNDLGDGAIAYSDSVLEAAADKIVADTPQEEQARAIENLTSHMQEISDAAITQGITPEASPIFTQWDAENLLGAAEAVRDGQAEQFAERMKSLGMDYDEALDSFQRGQTLDGAEQKLARDQEAELGHELGI